MVSKYGAARSILANMQPISARKDGKSTQALAYIKALGVADEALAKQIPREPIGDLGSVPHYRCPSCNSAIVVYENGNKYPHCQWCGQAIDWSDSDD